jgi:hypothetical protein
MLTALLISRTTVVERRLLRNRSIVLINRLNIILVNYLKQMFSSNNQVFNIDDTISPRHWANVA